MDPMPPVVRRLRVDGELLARLGPDSSRAEWERLLRRTGLWDLDPPDGPVGAMLRELQAAVRSWPPEVVEVRGGDPRWPLAYGGVALAGLAWTSAAGDLRGVVAALVTIGGMVWWRTRSRPRVPPEATVPDAARVATDRLRRLLARSFVTAAGEVVVENTPHVDYLEVRGEQLAEAERALDGRMEELRTTLGLVREANTRLGQPAEDAETARLVAALDREEATRRRLVKVRSALEARLAEVREQLGALRGYAERQALSERVQRMAEGGAPIARRVAEVDVDVAAIEAEIAALALESRDADARVRAVLEVVGAQNVVRPRSSG